MIHDKIKGRIISFLIVLLCANSMFGQRTNVVSLSLKEIKDMPQKIIRAYFKPVYTAIGVSYPLMQWYASENKVDTWDKNALIKFNDSIYGFKDNPIKAAEFALQFCRTFGERDFIDNFQAIGFNTVEINSIGRFYLFVKSNGGYSAKLCFLESSRHYACFEDWICKFIRS